MDRTDIPEVVRLYVKELKTMEEIGVLYSRTKETISLYLRLAARIEKYTKRRFGMKSAEEVRRLRTEKRKTLRTDGV